MREVLSVTRRVILDAAGTGMLTVGPSRYRETWKVTRYSTNGNSTLEPRLDVYRGAAGGRLIDTTRRGNAAVSENTELEIKDGESLTFVYSEGSPNAALDIHVEGEISYALS